MKSSKFQTISGIIFTCSSLIALLALIVMLIFSALGDAYDEYAQYAYAVFLGNMGVLFIFTFMTQLYRLANCTETVTARYHNCKTVYSHKTWYYAPIFTYCWEGREYTSQAPSSYSRRKITKKYVFDHEYTIYIDPKEPEVIIEEKKLTFSSFLSLFVGVFFLFIVVAFFGL